MKLLINGDARHIALPDESVHCVVTSPPYYNQRLYGVEGEIGLEKTPDEYVCEVSQIFREIQRVLRKDGTVWLNLGDSYAGSGKGQTPDGLFDPKRTKANGMKLETDNPLGMLKPKDIIGIPWRVAFALQGFALISIDQIAELCRAIDNRDMPALDYFRAGFMLWEELSGMDWYWNRQDIIWHKTNGMPEPVKDRCTHVHEYIFLLSKSRQYYYDYQAVMEEANYDGRKDEMAKDCMKDYGEVLPDGQGNEFAQRGHRRWQKNEVGVRVRNRRSVWNIPTKAYPDTHYVVFPPDLIEPCILAGCPEGGIVLDPFVGSGTTVWVAEKLGRHGIGADLSFEYLDENARKRLDYGGYRIMPNGMIQEGLF